MLRTTTVALFVWASVVAADAATYVLKGQVGYVGEWALQASLAPSAGDAKGRSYSGAMTLRHVGLCTTSGPQEKPGLATASLAGDVATDLTLTFTGDRCVYAGPLRISSRVARGYIRCGSGSLVPISLWAVP